MLAAPTVHYCFVPSDAPCCCCITRRAPQHPSSHQQSTAACSQKPRTLESYGGPHRERVSTRPLLLLVRLLLGWRPRQPLVPPPPGERAPLRRRRSGPVDENRCPARRFEVLSREEAAPETGEPAKARCYSMGSCLAHAQRRLNPPMLPPPGSPCASLLKLKPKPAAHASRRMAHPVRR